MSNIKILLFGIVIMTGCINDSKEFGYYDIYNETNSDLVMIRVTKDSTSISMDTIIANKRYNTPGVLEDFTNSVSSVEFITIDNAKSIVYYHPDVNEENYQLTIDKTIFRVKNWEKLAKYKHVYHIKETDFD
jgi:hypothetical protein